MTDMLTPRPPPGHPLEALLPMCHVEIDKSAPAPQTSAMPQLCLSAFTTSLLVLLGACQIDFDKKGQAADAGQDGGGSTGADNSGGTDATTGGNSAGGSTGENSTTAMPMAPSGFATVGGHRTDGSGKYAVYDDGFEGGPRSCSSDARFCVTGGFTP